MAKWKFRYFGDPILRKKCELIDEITDEIKELAHFMIEYADTHNGIGMAAPQVGVPVRLFVLRDYIIDEEGKWTTSLPKVFINPIILSKSEEEEADDEGCMSFPNMQVGPIFRPKKIVIEATDLNGKRFVEEREGINARVTFHENDHLNGVLHIDRLPSAVRKNIDPELRALKKKYSSLN